MSIELILVVVVGIFSFVFAIAVAVYLTKFLRFIPKNFPAAQTLADIIKPQRSRLRDSSCMALSHKAVRHTSAAYTTGFVADAPSTILADEEIVNEHHQAFERLLTSEKPTGTIIQIRWANHLENGQLLLNETRPEKLDNIYFPARVLHEESLNQIWNRIVENGFRSPRLSVWLKVPTKHASDNLNNGLALAFKQMKQSFRWSNILGTFSIFFGGLKNDGVVRRLLADEEKCQEQAEKVFQSFQRDFPLKTRRLNNLELWNALYLGHNEKERIVPEFPDTQDTRFVDIRGYLCQDDIRFGEDFVLHGETPAAIVSMTLPPAPVSHNAILSRITQNPRLRFRYTVVGEFLHYGKTKSLKKINRSIFWNSKNPFKTPESKRAGDSLAHVRDEMASPNAMLGSVRVYAIVYGDPVKSQPQLKSQLAILDENCETIISLFKQLPGANAIREDGDVLRQLYPKTLIGECDAMPTGIEIDEMTPQLASFGTLQGAWRGFPKPHTIIENASGELFGINLLQSKHSNASTAVILGTTGSGKSVVAGKFIKDILGSRENASVVAMDFGETFAPLVQTLGGRQIRFVPNEQKAINIWSYDQLEKGLPPDEAQIALVIGDLLLNAGIRGDDREYSLYSAICDEVVRVVYQNNAAQNGRGLDRKEPILSDFLDTLDNHPFEGMMLDLGGRLAQLLKRYRGNVWLDAPTHPDFLREDGETRFDVYELDSLESFQPEIQASIAYRVAASIITSAGKQVNGQFYPKLQVFDEMHKVKDKYPQIMEAILRGARMGRKANVLTILATQAYEDLENLHGLTSNAEIFIIGKQSYKFEKLAEHANLSKAAVQAVKNIRNVIGAYSQFVFAFGNGYDRKTEVGLVALSPMEYWSLTSAPVERNARNSAAFLMPNQPMMNVVAELAERYPHGLIAENKETLDDDFLNGLYQQAVFDGYFEDAAVVAGALPGNGHFPQPEDDYLESPRREVAVLENSGVEEEESSEIGRNSLKDLEKSYSN